MVSNINESSPVTGVDQPAQDLRDNFSATKIEIEDLQTNKINKNGDTMTGILELQRIQTNDLPPADENISGLLFNVDTNVITFSDGTEFLDVATVGNIEEAFRTDSTPGPATTFITQDDSTVVLTSGAPDQSVFLPPANLVSAGKTITLIKGFGTPNAFIVPNGDDIIDGFGSAIEPTLLAEVAVGPPGIPSGFNSVTLVSDGIENWFVIESSYHTGNEDPVWVTAAGSIGAFDEGVPMVFPLVANDPDSSPTVLFFVITAGTLPPGLSLDSNTGIISGTPSAVVIDTVSVFEVTVTDSVDSDVREFTITIINL